MKTFFYLLKFLSLGFLSFITFVIFTAIAFDLSRRGFTYESLVEFVYTVALLLAIYFLSSLMLFIIGHYKLVKK